MHIKCGVVFRCCYALVQVFLCFIFVADASKITRALIQKLKHTPGTLWRSLTATFPGKQSPVLTEVSTERTQMTNWDWTTTKDDVYVEISFLKYSGPNVCFERLCNRHPVQKSFIQDVHFFSIFSFIINFYSS